MVDQVIVFLKVLWIITVNIKRRVVMVVVLLVVIVVVVVAVAVR